MSEEPSIPKAVVTPSQPVAKIVKRVPRHDPIDGKSNGMGGTYRVIHGRIAVPRDPAERLNADGSRNEHMTPFEYAIPGDHVTLGDDDAYRMLGPLNGGPDDGADVIEPLDAKPSRLGKVFTPPKPVPDTNQYSTPPSPRPSLADFPG